MAAVMRKSSYHSLSDYRKLPSKQFLVKNVDDKGRIIHIGYLEVTSTEIIFIYEHYPSEVTHWPLVCIRRYGQNSERELFVVEIGRRAPNGAGHYAFKTKEAADIVERLDHYTTMNTS